MKYRLKIPLYQPYNGRSILVVEYQSKTDHPQSHQLEVKYHMVEKMEAIVLEFKSISVIYLQ